MQKLNRGRLLLSTCLSGVALAWAPGVQAQAQTQDSSPATWQPRAEVDARAANGNSQVSFELFAPVAQNDSNLLFVAGRIGTDERYDRNGSVTIGGRGKIGEDVAIGVNAGVDFYKTDITSRDQTAVSFGLEGFTSVFDLHANYRLPVNRRRTMGYLDPNASPVGVVSIENNRLIERKSGWRLEEVPLAGANAEIGATAPLSKQLSVRASVAGFDYRDDAASKSFRGIRGGLELGVEDPLGTGGRFSLGAELQNDNRWGTQARGTVRLSIPLGRGSRDRSAGTHGLDRQMGERLRRDYVTPSGTRYTDLTSTSFAVDARTGAAFGGVYFTSGSGTAGAAGTITATTTLSDAVTRAGANGIVVALGNAGTIASSGVTLATNQYLVGGASSVNVRHSDGSVSAYSFGGTNGIVAGTNAGGAAVTLGQGSVVRDVTVRGAGSGILANGVGGFALERVIIENTGAAGLTLTNTTGAVVVDGITIRGGAGAGVVVNGGSNVTLRNSTIGGGAGAIDINDAGGNLTTTLSSLTLSATGGNVLDIDGSGAGTVTVAGLSGINITGGNGETGGFAARNVTFDSSTAAGIQAVNAGAMQVGTSTARVGGAGVTLTDVDGALSFTNLNIANNGGTGLTVNNTKTGTFTLSNAAGTVDTTAGTALNLDPLRIDLTFSSVRSVGATGAGIILDNVQGAGTGGNALTIGTLTITNSGQQGLYITGGSTGLVTIGGGAITNSGGASVQVGDTGVAGSGGTIGLTFGAAITDAGAGPLVSLFNVGGAIRFTGAISGAGPITIDGTTGSSSIAFAGSTTIAGASGTAISINNIGGAIGFTGAVTITNPTGSGIAIGNTLAGSSVLFSGATTITGAASPALALNNLAGATAFSGTLTIANPAGTGIVIGNVPGGVTFGDVDITGLGAGTGLDVTGTQGNVTFGTLDISGTGAAGSTGIDLTGATNAGAITIANPSVIQGVDIGVNLTNANITGSFQFGDGNAADGVESRITANTVIVVTGMNGAQGTYNFADVILDGDTNNITGGSFTAYYVLAGATGTGTANDPGSISGAAASGAQYIVLLNDPNGGQDVIDTSVLVGGALNLTAGQSLVSFLNSDFFAITGATVPANLIVTNLGPTGIVNTYAGSGAAILTSSTGGATVNLANDTRIDGVVVHNDAAGTGIVGSGVSNVIIRNSTVSGNGGAISIIDGGTAASATLTNLNLSASGGTVLNLSGAGAGTLNVSGTGINIVGTGMAQGLVANDVTVGTLDIGSVSTGAAGGLAAVQVTQVAGGTVNIGNVAVGGATAGVGLGVANNAATVNIGAVTATNTAGVGVVVSGNTGNVTLGAVTVSNTGSDGVRVTGNSGNVSIGAVASNNAGGSGIRVSNTTGNVDIASASITGAADGFEVSNLSGNLTVGATSIANSTGVGILVNGVGGTLSFGATTITNSTGIELGAGSTGTISFGDTDITGLGANQTGVDARSSGGTVTFTTLDITGASTTGTRGIDLTGATFAGSFSVIGSSAITGVGTGVDLTNAAITGSFRYGDGSNTDANGAASTINAITPIAIGGLNQTVGTYNFSDVNLVGDITNLAINPVTVFFVEQGRTGAGTKTDPGSLAAAQASGANYIVLLNNPTGGQDVLDVGGLGTLTLGANQHLIGFLNGDTQTVGGGTPANLFLYGITPGIVTNPYLGSGASLLTNTGAGATVTLSSGSSIDGVRIGGLGLGVSGVGAANVSITNSIISGGTGAILLRDGGAAASATLTNLALSTTGGMALAVFGANGGSMTLNGSGLSIAATGTGRGVAIDSVTLNGNLSFTTVSTDNAGGTGVTLADIGGTGSLNFSSIAIGGTSAGNGISISGNSAAIGLGTVTIGSVADIGVSITGNTGGGIDFTSIAVGGAAGGSGVLVDGNSAAIGLGDVTVANATGNGIEVANNTGNVTLGTFDISNTSLSGVLVSGMSGTFTAAGGTIVNAGAAGISIGGLAGSATFTGAVTITNPGAAGVVLGAGSTGTIAFADVDILGLGDNTTGLDARLASGNISFGTLDITGASINGTRGIDLTGATFGGNLIVSGSSTITGVDIGVDLTNAAITGSFRFGDGSNTDANGAASTISAETPIVITGLNAAIGAYDFADVNLIGETSTLSSSATVYWVVENGTGDGSRNNPGSLQGALNANRDVIILLNNPTGGNDIIDAVGVTKGAYTGTVVLSANQQLLGFLNGDTLALPGGTPANLFLYNIAQGVVTNPFAGSGAPTLTTTQGGGADTVRVLGNNLIDGVRITGAGTGIYGSAAPNVTIRNSIISGGDSAIELAAGGSAASAALSNLVLTTTGNSIPLALYAVGGGSMTVTQLANITITQGVGSQGAYLEGATFDADLATAGYQAVDASLFIGTAGQRLTGNAVNLSNALGALNFTDLAIYNQSGTGILATGTGLTLTSAAGTIDTLNGVGISLSNTRADLVLDGVTHAGTGNGITALNVTGAGIGGRALDVANLTITGAGNGISIGGTTTGSFSFGAASSISGTTGAAIAIGTTAGPLDFTYAGSVSVTGASALLDVSGHAAGTVTFTSTSNLSATNGTGLNFSNADGTYAFNGTTTLNGGDAGIDILGGSAGNFTFGTGTSITSPTGIAFNIADSTATVTYGGSITQANSLALVQIFNHSGGTVTFETGTLSATNGTGLQFINADGTYAFNGTTTLNGGNAGIDILNGSAGSFTFGTGTSITSPVGVAFSLADSTATVTYGGSITQANNAALVSILNHAGGTVTFQTGTLGATNGTGLQFDNADGTYAFNGTTMLNGGDAGIDILNGSAGSFTFAAGTTITSPSGAAFNIAGSTAGVTYLGAINQSLGAAVTVAGHSAGTLDFSGATLTVTGGDGLSFDDADGTYSFGSATLTGGAQIGITNGSAGTFTFGAGTSVTNAAGAALFVSNSTANLTYSGQIGQSLAGLVAVDIGTHSGGTIDFTGATFNITGGTGISFFDADGTYNFGDLALSGGARLAILGGSAGTFTFGNVDITGLAANTTAANLTGATGNVTFATLDITGASTTGTRGIDMTGSTTAGNVIISGSSQITGVGIGVDLTNAAITGNFRYGDGSNSDANGAASNITAVTPLVIAGLNGGSGVYNFADVNMNGDTTNLSVSAYFVLAGATGTGTRSDPGSLAGAEASGATYIVLLNDPTGGTDVLDATADAGGSLDLAGGQSLYGFRDTDSFTVGGGAPANVLLFNVQTGVISNPFAGSGAPTLTASGANATVTLGGGNTIDGVVIANSGTGAGVLGNGAAAPIIIRNSTISGGAAGAIRIYDNAANVTLALNNLTLAANGGNILNLDGSGTGTFIVTQLSNLTVNHTTETGGFVFNDLTFDSDTVTAGIQAVSAGNLTLGTTGSRITGDGLSLTNVVGTLNFGDLNIANNAGTGLIVANSKTNNFVLGTTGGAIDTTNGTAINLDPLTIHMVLGSVRSTGGAYGILLDQVEGDFTVTGGVSVTGATNTSIAIRNNTAQTDPLDVHFQGGTILDSALTTGAGVSLTNNSGATVEFTGSLGIYTSTGAGLTTSGGGTISVTGAFNGIYTGNAPALSLSGGTIGAAGLNFLQITAAPAAGTAVSASGVTLTGSLNIGGLDIDGGGTGVALSNLSGGGSVNLTGTLDLDTSGVGFDLSGALGTVNIANATGSALTIDGASTGIRLNGLTSGTINVANVVGSASIGGTTSSTVAAIGITGSSGGTLNYGGTINASAGSALTVFSSSMLATLSGAITSTTAGTAFSFFGAGGIYTIAGAVSHNGGMGVDINATSTGNVSFLNASKTFSTGTNTAISMAGTGTLTLLGGGLGITTTSGIGLSATAGTVSVLGSGNTITTATGQILGLSGVTSGSGGITFDSLAATGTVANNGILLSNLTGAAFNGGTVNIGGTSGGANDGIKVVTGSAAITFGATTIGTAASNAIELLNSGSAVSFGTMNLSGAGGSTVVIAGSTGAVTLGAGTITATGAANYAVSLTGGTGDVTIGSALGGTNMVQIVDHETGTVTFSGNMASTVSGISVTNVNSGLITFTGQTLALNATSAGVTLAGNSGGTIDFNMAAGGNGLDIVSTGSGFNAGSGGTVIVRGSGNSISTTGTGTALSLQNVTIGTNGFTFDSVSTNGATTGILFNGVGTVAPAIGLGTVNLQGITSRGIDVTGILGAGLSITDLDIGLNSNSAVALDLNGATLSAPIIVGDFDVTNSGGAGTSIGVDLRGTLGGANILLGGQLGASSSISGVGTGIYLDASTNALLTYGDGEAGIDTGSTISATTAINAAAAPTVGTYDFRDVAFSGSPGSGFGLGKIYFVDSNGATGGGDGSGSDGINPMTLAAAELAALAEDIIVLVNNGNAITAGGSNGNDSLVLASNVQVRGFGDGVGGGAGTGSAPIVIALTVPSTILLSGGGSVSIADPTGNGAATLTSSAGANAITLGASGNHLSGFILDGGGAVSRGIKDNGAGATNTLLDYLTVRNFGTMGIEITPSTSTTIDHVSFSGNPGGDVLLNAANSVLTNIVSNGGGITINNATGTTTLTNVNLTNGNGLVFNTAAGTINATNVDITSPVSTGLTIAGGTANFNFDSTSSVTKSNAGAALSIGGGHNTGTFAYAGTLNITGGTGLQFDNADGTYNFTGTTTLAGGDAGIDILNGSGGTFSFGANTAITSPSGTAFNVSGSTAAITYSGSITQANNAALVSFLNHSGGTVTFQTGTLSATNGTGLQFDNADATYNFTGTATLNGGDAGIDILNGSGGSFNFSSGTSITSPTGAAFNLSGSTAAVIYNGNITQANNAALVNVLNHSSGTVTFQAGTLSATNGTGLQFNNADGTYNLNTTTTLNGGDAGIDIVNGSDGTFNFGLGVGITHAAAGDAFVLTDSNAAVGYLGSITDSNGYAVRIDNHDAGTVTFSGSSTISSSGANALGLSVTNSNGGSVNFNGTTTLSTQANNAVTLSANAGSTVAFSSVGSALGITTTSGTAFVISGGGTINATGPNSTITTGTGTIFDISNASAATTTLGMTFASASNTLGTNGILISRTAGTLTGSVTVNAGSITATSRGIDVDGGTLSIDYAGSVATSGTTVRSVEVTNITGGAITVSGNLTDNALGINIANNSGGSINFYGQSITLNTVANVNAVTLASNTGANITFSSAAGGNGVDITASGTGNGIDFTGGGNLTVYSTGNSIQTATGQILNLVNGNVGSLGLVFDSLTSTGSTNGSAINISNVDGTGTLSATTVSIAGTTGPTADGIFYGGGSTMNVNLGTVTIANTGDEGIEINGAGNGTFTAGSVTINNTGGNGVEINGATNSVNLAGGAIGATNDPTGFGVYILNGTGAVTIGSSITKTTGNSVVLVDNHETGNVAFSGNISATGGVNNGIVVQNVNSGTIGFLGTTTLSTGANTALNLLNNTGGTITFPNGGLAITTTSGTGFSATGGGIVTTAGTGNTITSTTGTALNVVNTTIGSSGLRFQSISSNGASSGIILNNTGTSGGINVTGTGAAGSGGTIQNSAGDGISLTSTENVRLAYMNVTNNLGDGIGGANINGFLIDNMLISGNGNDAGTDESGINITELTGTASNGARPTGIFNSTIQNNNEFEVQITNSTGTLANFQVVNSTFASNGVGINGNGTSPHGNIFNFLGTGTSAMGISVSGSNFTGNWNAASPPTTIVGSGLFADSSGTSMTVQVNGSFFTNTNNGINVSTGPGSTTLTYNIDNNNFVGTRSTAINDFQNGNAPFTRTVYGRITNNIIGNNAVTNSGSNVGNGISIGNEGGVNATYLISGNTIQQIQTSQGIVVNVGLVGQATGNLTTNVTILNNTIRNINGSRGLVINNNQNTGGFPTVNVSISGNSFSGIAGQAGNGQYLRLSASGGGTINVTQGQATASAIASELDDANGFNDTTKISIGTGTFNYGQPAPTLPPASVPLP